MAKVLINGQAYTWAQIKVNVLGRQINGIAKISYKEKEEMQDNFGAGNRPVSRSYGKITAEGSMELHMEELEALQAATPDGRIQSIPEFDIVVSYQPNQGKIVNHTLHNCRMMENGREASNEDMLIKTEIPLLISHISFK